MPEYRVLLARSAERDLASFPQSVRTRIIEAIDRLAEDPRPKGVKKLRGRVNLWRLRVGEYRVIYGVDDGQRVVDISHIRHRREAYR